MMINKYKIILVILLTILITFLFTKISIAQNNNEVNNNDSSETNSENNDNNETNENNDDTDKNEKAEKLKAVLLTLDRQKLEEIADALEIEYSKEDSKEILVEKILTELFEDYEEKIDIINENINNNNNNNDDDEEDNENDNYWNNQQEKLKEMLNFRIGAGSHIPLVSVDNGVSQWYRFKLLLAIDYGLFFKFDDGGAVGIDFYMMFLEYDDYFDIDGFIHLSYMYEFSLKSQFGPALFASIGVDFTSDYTGLGFKLGTQMSFAPNDSSIRVGLRIMLSMAYLTGKEEIYNQITDVYTYELKRKFLITIPITLFFSFSIK
jgi:hypothetical protein